MRFSIASFSGAGAGTDTRVVKDAAWIFARAKEHKEEGEQKRSKGNGG